jgi:hypothetical protein
MTKAAGTRSVPEIEAEIAAARERLARTVDELHARTAPKEVLRRQVDAARAALFRATHTDSGGLRVERVAALATAALLFVGLGAWRRHRG